MIPVSRKSKADRLLSRMASMQALGGSGACHMGAKLLRMHYEPYKVGARGTVYIPKDTWGKYYTSRTNG